MPRKRVFAVIANAEELHSAPIERDDTASRLQRAFILDLAARVKQKKQGRRERRKEGYGHHAQ
jgi:hypothetical protein